MAVVYLRHVQRAMIPALTEIMPAEVRVAGSRWPTARDRGVWRLHAGDFHSAD